MRGYKRTPKKPVTPVRPVVKNGQIMAVSIDLEELAEQKGYKSLEEFMLQSDFLDRYNDLKKQFNCPGAKIMKC